MSGFVLHILKYVKNMYGQSFLCKKILCSIDIFNKNTYTNTTKSRCPPMTPIKAKTKNMNKSNLIITAHFGRA